MAIIASKTNLTFPRQSVGIGRYGQGAGNDNMVTLTSDGGQQLKQFAVKLFRCSKIESSLILFKFLFRSI